MKGRECTDAEMEDAFIEFYRCGFSNKKHSITRWAIAKMLDMREGIKNTKKILSNAIGVANEK
jgi:hypothetical protein